MQWLVLGVLIETLWNVKTIVKSPVSLVPCINRNIVECKDACITSKHYLTLLVLIETLWNVKLNEYHHTSFLCVVLIETLWNVKRLS